MNVQMVTRNGLATGRTWGFVVLRPKNAASNDAEWAAAVSKIRDCVAYSVNYERVHENPSLDPEPDEIVMRSLRLPTVDLPLEPGQSPDLDDGLLAAARTRFNEWRANRLREEQNETVRVDTLSNEVCILLDAATVRTLVSADPATTDCSIVMVDRDWRDINPPFYAGWMRAEPGTLDYLWSDLKALDMNEIAIPPEFEGQIPLYDSSPTCVMIDPPSGVGARLPGTQRGTRRGA